jgi:integrase
VRGGAKGWRLKGVITLPGQSPLTRWKRLTPREAYSAHTREAARDAFLEGLAIEFNSGAVPTFTDLAHQFYASAQARALAEGSLATLRRHIDRDVLPHIGTLEPARITHHDCQLVIDAAAAAGYEPNSLRRVRFAMSKLFSFAMAEGICQVNPTTGMPTQPKATGTTELALTAAQYRDVLRAADGTPWRLVIEFIHATWMRRGELCGLQWGDIDFTNRTVIVRRAVWQTGRACGIKPPKTKAGNRPIVLPQAIADRLAEHRDAQQAWLRDVAERDCRPDDFVFQRAVGGHLLPTTVSHAISDCMRAAGLPARVGAHALRHTGASIAMALGSDPRAVADRLGHASVATTLDLYVHPSRQAQIGLADIMAKAAHLAAE